MPRGVAILGSTGSIGRNALRVMEALGPQYRVMGLSAHSNVELLAQQTRRYKPRFVAVTNGDFGAKFRALVADLDVQVLTGAGSLTELVQCEQVDTVLTAVVGAAGLPSALAAARAGKRLAIANKEPLVMAGELLTRTAREHGSMLLPVDSEHSAVFQAMQSGTGRMPCGQGAPPWSSTGIPSASSEPCPERSRTGQALPVDASDVHGPDAHAARGQDARETQGRDALATRMHLPQGQSLPRASRGDALATSASGAARQVERILLTGSGGPFRGATPEDLREATLEQALAHPVWNMGPKITIDSATMMNKALEVLEARWLFDVPVEKIEVLIHPESIVHSLVEFVDGSVIAQLGEPDMCLPIQYALTYPDRVPGLAKRLRLEEIGALHFERPNPETFRALALAYEVGRAGGTAAVVFNAANEAAVEQFLAGRIKFLRIMELVEHCLSKHQVRHTMCLEELLEADAWARREARKQIDYG